MFSSLSQKLLSVFDALRKRGILTEEILDVTIREIRKSLLEADVALSVTKTFTANLRERLIGQKAIKSTTPEQTIIKAVYDELVVLLGDSSEADNIGKKKAILLTGLQGTGKTTTAAKLACLLKSKFKKNVLLVSLDTYRPAAIEQLRKLAKNNGIEFFAVPDLGSSNINPITIAQDAVKVSNRYDTVIYDTAGRLHIDSDMMDEVKSLKQIINPDEVLLIIDSMMGQDAINTARAFHEAVTVTGLILTCIDGDSRGGAALSAKSVTNCQIKYICTGEQIGDIQVFHPDCIASRILDKGDVLSLVEKAMDEDTLSEIKDVPTGKNFNLNGMEQYLKQMEKLGGISGFLKFLPGVKKVNEQLQNANLTDKMLHRQIAIIRSMTPMERKNPKILNASRKRRIASGCGRPVSEINILLKQFEQLKMLMSKCAGNPGLMQQISGRFLR
ncbi:MAG: signal recognition particle protein [Holosporales bacterium]|jgi:signal recognition particle subunit SRP54|nr:signal recognition particle protein [Holosporales bacterium]